MIPYGRQDIDASDIQAVVDVLRSEHLTQGPAVPAFENAVAAYCGAAHAVAVNSATSALHVACIALGVGPGDLVWTSPITFVASANCARYCGADVDFVDIDARTWNMSAERLEEKLAAAQRAGRLPTVVIPVHLCGQPCDMAAIGALAGRYGFRVIEDASHAIGARYAGELVGNCRFSDITVFSFHPVKIVTSGEGGIAVTNDAALARRMALARNHGITREAAEMTHEPDGAWYYQQISLGFNYRLTDLHAALGRSQLTRIDEFVRRRRALAARYDRLLADVPVIRAWQHFNGESAWHLYVVRVGPSGRARRAVFDDLRRRGIGVNLHYIPVYLQPYYRGLGFADGHCAEAEAYYADAITLPMFAAMSDAEQDTVIDAVRASVAAQAAKP